jgi:hypothetical protein
VARGLGFLDDKGQKYPHRGRKSYMSLTQKQASSKIKCGKQMSFIRALREISLKDVLK